MMPYGFKYILFFFGGEIMKKKLFLSISFILLILISIAILSVNKAKINRGAKQEISVNIPVNITTVIREKIKEELSIGGTISAYNDVMIISETQGKVRQVFAEVGDRLSAGSALIKVEDEILYAAYITAEINLEKAKKDYERFRKLTADSSIAVSQLENMHLNYKSAEAKYIVAKKQYEDTKITTPISGIVASRMAEIGNMVSPGMPIANIVDISKLKIKINISEKDIFKIKTGDKVYVTVDAYPEHKFEGKIKTISDKADQTHTYPIEINLNNDKSYPLKAGMFGRALFNTSGETESLIIPREALSGSSREPQVFVVKDNIAEIRDLVIGIETGSKIQVLKGLNEGEIIVTNGQNNLKDKSIVTIIR
jgi:RND family efflux transporter MFP subunit